MPTTYAAAVSLAESMYITPTNPHGWVPGFFENPTKFLNGKPQQHADAGQRLLLANAGGRGGTLQTFSKRFDGKDAKPTVVEWPDDYGEQLFALSNFVKSPGLEGTFLYIGAPDTTYSKELADAAFRLELFRRKFPGCIPIYDNVGDIDSSELCAGSALFAAHDAMASVPFNSPVPWGIEPNPAWHNLNSPVHLYRPRYVYGTPATWSATSRIGVEKFGATPIVAIRGDEYDTPEGRLAIAPFVASKVAPYNGIVVVHRVSVEQMEGLTR